MDIGSRRTANPYLDALGARAAAVPLQPGTSSYFTAPETHLDPALFDGMKMKPAVRRGLLSLLFNYMAQLGYHDAHRWLHAWVAGSGASYQWSAARDPGDLDVLLGVEHDLFYELHPQFQGVPADDVDNHITEQLRAGLWPVMDRTHIGVTSNLWVELPPNTPQLSEIATRLGLRSQPSPRSSATPPTQSASTLSALASRSATSGDSVHSTPAASAKSSLFTQAASAESASATTSGSNTSGVSTGSPKPSTTDSWWSRKVSALSVAGSATVGTVASTSTIVTPQGGSAASSASPATTPSASSGTTSQGLSGYSPTSAGDSVYSVTWYVNPGSSDIRNIVPYAAYSLTSDVWTVEPIKIPAAGPGAWFDQSFTDAAAADEAHAKDILARYENARAHLTSTALGPQQVNAAVTLRHVVAEGAQLFDDIHLGRHEAFKPGGSGYRDWANYRWQSGKRSGIVPALNALKGMQSESEAETQRRLYGHELTDAHHTLSTVGLYGKG